MKNNLSKSVTAAMFAAFICVATMLIQIPSPMNGYVNLGDCFVLAAAWVLGPVYGFAAGGVGSAMADLLSGYPHYIPATFIIKGLMAVAASLIARAIITRKPKAKLLGYLTSSVVAELIMASGYCLYAAFIFGEGTAAFLSVPGNLVQGICGVAAGTALITSLSASGVTRKVKAYAEATIS